MYMGGPGEFLGGKWGGAARGGGRGPQPSSLAAATRCRSLSWLRRGHLLRRVLLLACAACCRLVGSAPGRLRRVAALVLPIISHARAARGQIVAVAAAGGMLHCQPAGGRRRAPLLLAVSRRLHGRGAGAQGEGLPSEAHLPVQQLRPPRELRRLWTSAACMRLTATRWRLHPCCMAQWRQTPADALEANVISAGERPHLQQAAQVLQIPLNLLLAQRQVVLTVLALRLQ